MTEKKYPKPDEIQKEFEDFVRKRFGEHVQVISQEMPTAKKKHTHEEKTSVEQPTFDIEFDYKPREIKEYLDRFVVRQDEAKKALAIAFCDHYNQVVHSKKQRPGFDSNYAKQNILILGPTGVGKTYMIKQISNLIGVPFVKADATRFSETGYMGANVEDLVKDLVNQADGDISKAQYGIIYLDEADKLATSTSHSGRDVSGRGVQLGLLKLMEETDVDLRAGQDPASQMQAFLEIQQKGKVEKQIINTKHILFIVSGAFTGLEEIVAKRIHQNNIGFHNERKTPEEVEYYLNHASTKDFIDYGFEPEFIGRLPVRVACHNLDKDDLCSILKNSEGSILKQYKFAFQAYGIDINFSSKSLEMIAKLAEKEKTGARALMTMLEKKLRDFKFFLPSTSITELDVTEELIENPKNYIDNIIKKTSVTDNDDLKKIKAFEDNFFKDHGMKICFDSAAIEFVKNASKEHEKPIEQVCFDIFQSYEHGLKLIQQNTGQSEFFITKEIVQYPKRSLEKLVKDSYNPS